MDKTVLGNIAEHLLDYVENDRTFMTDKSITVPSTAYTDADQWQKEMNLIFKRLPLMLALTCEMPKPGDYKAMEVMEQPILMTRDKAGKVRAFYNVCAHRGAVVAPEGTGNCSRFSCPYHGWTYSSDGRLMGVSDPHKFGDVDKHSRGLKELPCEERAGMIFVSLTAGASLDLDDYFQGFLADFEDADLANWTFLGAKVIEGANWKIAFDGYLEGYHFSTLHPETINPRTHSNVTHYEGFGPSMRIGFAQRGIEGIKDVPREQWGDQENTFFNFVRILFPNVSAFLAPEIAQIAQLFPGPTPDKNKTVLMYVHQDPPTDEEGKKALDDMMNFLRDVVYNEDYLMGDTLQKGLNTGAQKDLIFGRNERGNQFFHEWLDWYLADDPSLPKPTM